MPFPGLNRAQVQTLIDASVSAYYTISEIDTLLSGKSSTGHTHDDRYYTETEIDALLSGFGGDHNHDDRYYTQAEVDTLLLGKASTSHTHDYSSVYAALVHNHDDRYYTDSEVDAAFAALSGVYAPSSHNHSASAITSGTLDASRLPDLSAVYSVVGHNHDLIYAALSHDHDSRYFTESEVTALLAGKSDTTHNHDLAYATLSHTHDDRYYTESEVDTLLSGKASSTHSHAASDIDSGILANARVNWAAPDALGSGTPAAAAFTNLSADALTIGGAGGAGFAQLANQESAPDTPTNSLRVYVDGANRLAWKHASGFVAVIDTSGFTANRTVTIPNTSGTLVMQAANQTLTNKTLTSPIIDGNQIVFSFTADTAPSLAAYSQVGVHNGNGQLIFSTLGANRVAAVGAYGAYYGVMLPSGGVIGIAANTAISGGNFTPNVYLKRASTGEMMTAKDTSGSLSSVIPLHGMVRNAGAAEVPLAGFGISIPLKLKTTTTNDRDAAYIEALWNDPTNAGAIGEIVLSAAYNANGTVTKREGLRVRGTSTATLLSFFGATPIAKPTITGSRGGNAALTNLLTQLAALGLITDSTTA